MKLRKILFLSAFLMAIGASFAFTNKSGWGSGYYIEPHMQNECTLGDVVEDFCSDTNTGPACTIIGVGGVHRPAYEVLGSDFTCQYPIYQPGH